MSRPGKASSRCLKKAGSIDMTSSKWPCFRQSLTIRILPSRSMIWALISPTFSLRRISRGSLPSTICWRISGTHLGQSESVVRGQPRGGLVFWKDLSRGLSDHLGVKEGLGLRRLRGSKRCQARLAAKARPFSRYLTGLCISLLSSYRWRSFQSNSLSSRQFLLIYTRLPGGAYYHLSLAIKLS